MRPAPLAAWRDRLKPGTRTGRLWAAAWTIMALINLAAGLWVSTWPDRRSDLAAVQRSGREWLLDGANVYESPDGAIDYPPHAILTLSPLGVISQDAAVLLWSIVNLGLAVLAVYLGIRSTWPTASGSTLLLPMAMFLCWGGFRTLLQFTLLSLTFALGSMRMAERQKVLSGFLLGLALMKPQVALPFVLWAAWTRRWRVLLTSAATVFIGSAVYCVRAHRDPLEVAKGYVAVLRHLYTGPDSLSGLSELRPLIAVVSADSIVDGVAATVGSVLLVVVCAIASHEVRGRRRGMIGVPALAAVWTVLTFRHLTYGFIVLLPVAAAMLWSEANPQERERTRILWLLQAALMVDLPGLGRWLEPLVPSSMDVALAHADRVLALALFVALVRLHVTVPRTDG